MTQQFRRPPIVFFWDYLNEGPTCLYSALKKVFDNLAQVIEKTKEVNIEDRRSNSRLLKHLKSFPDDVMENLKAYSKRYISYETKKAAYYTCLPTNKKNKFNVMAKECLEPLINMERKSWSQIQNFEGRTRYTGQLTP